GGTSSGTPSAGAWLGEGQRLAHRSAHGGRGCPQNRLPTSSGPFLGADQGRYRDQQRHGTKGNGWLAQNPCCNPVPKCLICRTSKGANSHCPKPPGCGQLPFFSAGKPVSGEHEQSGSAKGHVMIRGNDR